MSKDSKPATFTDMMDQSRILQPIGVKGKKLTCKVFFKGRGGALVYAGKTDLSAHLFDVKDPRNRFVGFLPTEEVEAHASAEKRTREARDNRNRDRRPRA
jgi:hypothetical protein